MFLEKQASSNGEHDGRDYDSQVQAQLEQLIKHKELTEAQARKLYQNDLREQIAYNKLLKVSCLFSELPRFSEFRDAAGINAKMMMLMFKNDCEI